MKDGDEPNEHVDGAYGAEELRTGTIIDWFSIVVCMECA